MPEDSPTVVHLREDDAQKVRRHNARLARMRESIELVELGYTAWLSGLMERYGLAGQNVALNVEKGTLTPVQTPKTTAN